jgi:glycosyltransferase involved in cell wall biosynthesis
VWPLVIADIPDAQFVIAGANPPAALVELAASVPRVKMTGFVDSLEPFYESADVFVAPLFTGAGVKFKTIDAMLRSVPIVTTDVGAEGLGGAELYAMVTREPGAFARGVVQALRMPDITAIEGARVWAESRFGFGPFSARLRSLYEGLLNGR